MTTEPFVDFQFWDALRVRVHDRLGCGAAKRFTRKFAAYRVENESKQPQPDLVFDLQPFDFENPQAYRFNQYRIAQGSLGKIHHYKIAKWHSRIEDLEGPRWRVRIWGNHPAQSVIPHQTMTSLVQLQLQHRGWSSLHAAAVDRDGQGMVIAGRRGVGKTTLVARLLEAGCAMVSEDRVFLCNDLVMALRVPVNLKYDRRDPKIIRLPIANRIRIARNRLIAAATGGYFSLHEPVDLQRWLPKEQTRQATQLKRLIYLQSGPKLHIQKNADPHELARQVMLGNQFDEPSLCEDLLAYRFCFPSPSGQDPLSGYEEKSILKLAQHLAGCECRLVMVPAHPTQQQWQQLVNEVTL